MLPNPPQHTFAEMTINVSDGHLQLAEGSLYWRYLAVDNDEDDPRPVLLFMHAGVTDLSLWVRDPSTSQSNR